MPAIFPHESTGLALEPLLTEPETAAALRVTDRTIRTWVAKGILSAVRIGGVKRYRASDIAALIDPSTRTGHAGNVTDSKSAVQATGDDKL